MFTKILFLFHLLLNTFIFFTIISPLSLSCFLKWYQTKKKKKEVCLKLASIFYLKISITIYECLFEAIKQKQFNRWPGNEWVNSKKKIYFKPKMMVAKNKKIKNKSLIVIVWKEMITILDIKKNTELSLG